MESHNCHPPKLPVMAAFCEDALPVIEEQHGPVAATSFILDDGGHGGHGGDGCDGGQGGHGGHGGRGIRDMDCRSIVDDVLAALPLLGRHDILPEVAEFY